MVTFFSFPVKGVGKLHWLLFVVVNSGTDTLEIQLLLEIVFVNLKRITGEKCFGVLMKFIDESGD